ncbi:serine/arginine repetitive matrix protein 3-like [Megalops cyprinoides]|uniref:serine/arginine repetitive matrix protein 3-like n=1 Tax=Megalops cyprinoides TaxID=118141 RepID=UPI0018653C01|nr:serine/arginine repetitive matrix protein 3-like [Megalops cyprinoides]
MHKHPDQQKQQSKASPCLLNALITCYKQHSGSQSEAMYDGAKVPSPQDGANGLPQPGGSSSRPKPDEPGVQKAESALVKRAHREILDHERKRRVELKCMELQEMMEEQGYSEEDIKQKVGTFRQMLMEKEGVVTREGSSGWQTVNHTTHGTEGSRECLSPAEGCGDNCDCHIDRYDRHAASHSDYSPQSRVKRKSSSSASPLPKKRKKKKHSRRFHSTSPPRKDKKKKSGRKHKRYRSASGSRRRQRHRSGSPKNTSKGKNKQRKRSPGVSPSGASHHRGSCCSSLSASGDRLSPASSRQSSRPRAGSHRARGSSSSSPGGPPPLSPTCTSDPAKVWQNGHHHGNRAGGDGESNSHAKGHKSQDRKSLMVLESLLEELTLVVFATQVPLTQLRVSIFTPVSHLFCHSPQTTISAFFNKKLHKKIILQADLDGQSSKAFFLLFFLFFLFLELPPQKIEPVTANSNLRASVSPQQEGSVVQTGLPVPPGDASSGDERRRGVKRSPSLSSGKSGGRRRVTARRSRSSGHSSDSPHSHHSQAQRNKGGHPKKARGGRPSRRHRRRRARAGHRSSSASPARRSRHTGRGRKSSSSRSGSYSRSRSHTPSRTRSRSRSRSRSHQRSSRAESPHGRQNNSREKDSEGHAPHTDTEGRSRHRSRTYSPIRKRRSDSPSFMEARRITSARKRPIPYYRPSPSSPSSLSSCSTMRSYTGSPRRNPSSYYSGGSSERSGGF